MLKALTRTLRPLATRPYATASIQTTVLPNGLTVASQTIPSVSTANVAVYVDTGSRAETAANNGIAHFLEHLSFKGTSKRSKAQIELEVENIGAHLNAYTSRENTCYWAKCLKTDVAQACDVLADIVTRSTYPLNAIEYERSVISQEYESVQSMTIEVLFDDLHTLTYQGHPLGYTILGPMENIRTLSKPQFTDFVQSLYKGDRMAVVGTGAINHEEFVAQVSHCFEHVPRSDDPVKLGSVRGPLPVFHGGEIATSDLSLKETFAVLAVEGCSWSDPDYATSLVAQTVIGNWERTQGVTSNNQLTITAATGGANGTPLANQYSSFTTNYKDTGLWGVYFMADQASNLKPLVDGILYEWACLRSGRVTEEAVEAAKDVLKGQAILNMGNNEQIGECIGRGILSSGRTISPEESLRQISQVTRDDVVRWAQLRLASDKPVAVACIGNTETLPNQDYIRAGMSMMSA